MFLTDSLPSMPDDVCGGFRSCATEQLVRALQVSPSALCLLVAVIRLPLLPQLVIICLRMRW